jgi:hypothetical protein
VSLLSKMTPPTCTPKNDLVFGIHHSRMQRKADGGAGEGAAASSMVATNACATASVAS